MKTVTVRQRRSTGELCMTLADFRQLDYGQLCAGLGLRPSKPHKSAAQLVKGESK